MSVAKITELASLMKEYDIVELELDEGDFSVALRKQGAFAPSAPPAPAVSVPAPAPVPVPVPAAGARKADAGQSDLVPVTSPIVGTIYRTPSPDAPPFVEVGAKVGKESIVCIIEAMKIMNEIKAEVEGVVEKILVESGEPVEYGQPLFLIKRPGA